MPTPATVDRWAVGRHSCRTPPRVALLVILAALVAACTGSPSTIGTAAQTVESTQEAVNAGPPTPDRWRSQVSFEPLDVPGEMTATSDRLDLGGLVAGTADRPAVLAAIRTEPAGRRRLDLSAWTGTEWHAVDAGLDVPGEPQEVLLAGDESVAVLGGWTWESGTVWPFLATSADRAVWTAVQLPASMDGFTVVAVAVAEGRVVALTQNGAHDAATVLIDPASGGRPDVNALPAVPPHRHRARASGAVAGTTVIVTGTQDAARTSAPMAFVSPDVGRTWSEPVAISPNAKAEVEGLVAVPGGFVATGQDLVPDEDKRPARASAWFSVDGLSWQAEAVPEPAGFRWDDHTSTLGLPRAAGDYVLAIASSSSSRSARPYQRQPTGEWIALTETNQVADGVGHGGQIVPATEPSGAEAPARALIAIEGAHGLSVADVRSGQWSNLIAPGSYIDPYFFNAALSGGTPQWRAVIRQRNFARFGDNGFRWWYEPAEVALTDNGLTALEWDPPETAGADDVRRGTDGTAEVVLATRFTDDPGRYSVAGWSRNSADQPWQPVAGFGAEPSEIVDGVGHFGPLWLAWGRHGAETGTDDHAMLWYSTDGVHFSRTDGDFGPDDRGSTIDEVCTGPNGEGIAVGAIDGSDDLPTATSWAADPSGRWHPTSLTGSPGTPSWFSECSTVDGRLWIGGVVDGADQRWQVGADGTPVPVTAPDASPGTQPSADPGATAADVTPESSDLTVPRAVSGGFVVTGRLDVAAYTGPVLWLSADGTGWTWVPVPTDRPDARVLADDVDGDLVVLSSSTTTSQAWRIPNIASVIASIPPTT